MSSLETLPRTKLLLDVWDGGGTGGEEGESGWRDWNCISSIEFWKTQREVKITVVIPNPRLQGESSGEA